MSRYLAYARTIPHSGTLATNILSRTTLSVTDRSNPTLMHPYVVKEGDRPDTIAAHYYGSPEYAWLVYLANDITDPYYEWPLNQNDFSDYIINKYGSHENAVEKILYFNVGWEQDDSTITISAYNSLPGNLKKFWAEEYDYIGRVSSYKRSELEVSIETNKVISITIENPSGSFINDQQVVQKVGSDIIASGLVRTSNTTFLTVDKIIGEFTDAEPVETRDESVSATVTAVTVLYTAIPSNEEIYWTPVTAYDFEEAANESKKTINIIDKRFVGIIEQRLKELAV